MSTTAKNLLAGFTAALERAERRDDRLTDDAQRAQRTELLSDALQTYRGQAENLLATASKPLDRNRLKKALATDWAAIPVKWAQVQSLLNAGQDFATIIDQATDQETLGAILEHAEAHLTAQNLQAQHDQLADRANFGRRGDSLDVDAEVTNIYDHAARRAVELGNTKAKHYLDSRAGQEADKIIAEKMLAYMNGDGRNPSMMARNNLAAPVLSESWERQADTAAAKVLGEPTPNEQDMAVQQAQRASQFNRDAAGADGVTVAPSETPEALAAKVPRGY
jgi:hypothetical protein